MPLKLNFGLNQKLTISHRMQQSLTVLSLSYEELNQAIQQELLENPLLETVKPVHSPSFHRTHSEAQSFRMYDFLEANYKKTNKVSQFSAEDYLSEPVSLKSYVLQQAEMSFFPKKVKVLLPVLISYLDDRAYLNLDIEEMAEKEKIPLHLLQESLKALQSLEPIGLGGRNLKECLLIQLRHKKEDTKKAELIVKHHLKNIIDKKYKAIAYDLNISMEETVRLCRLIQSLEPNPARNFSSQPTVFIRPDLYIYKQGTNYHVILNKEDTPNLRFSHEYVKAIKKTGKLNPQEKKYLNEKTTSARWFIRAIQQRQEKIKKIANYLIKYQKGFFEKGDSYLQPLKMQDLADEMAVHVSTISRTVNNKYAYTPQGIVALKHFFQKGLMTERGDFISISRIKEAIKQWINEEEPGNPLSDGDIRDKIYEVFHIYLLRRSISQYRSSMNIPPIRVRKLSFLKTPSIRI